MFALAAAWRQACPNQSVRRYFCSRVMSLLLSSLAELSGPIRFRISQSTIAFAEQGLTTSAVCGLRAGGNKSVTSLPAGSILQLNACLGRLSRSFASTANGSPGAEVQAKPIKKGLSAGTTPPATDQVPPGAAQQPDPSVHSSASLSGTTATPNTTKDARMSSAMVGVDRPSAAAVPAGVDQVPPSSTARTASAQTPQDDDPKETELPTPASEQSMQSVIDDIGEIGQLKKGSNKTPDASSIGRWQGFKWWVWGTPEEYWTYPESKQTHSSTSHATHATASTTDKVGGRPKWQRSRWSIADIIGSAILRSGVTKDEDVARFASKSAAIAIYTLAGFSLLGTIGVDTKPLVAGLGVGGFTVGFALRDVATNFVSGVLLVLQRPFEKGNSLRVHAGSTVLEGVVQSIELRYIVLKPKDQSLIMIPASIVYANPVVVLK